MTLHEEDIQDANVPAQAVAALAAAQLEATKKGREIVVVVGNSLVLKNSSGVVKELKTLAPRVKVQLRKKQSKA